MDSLWYKDAIIYETHVKAFYDANNDGIGDFPGLLQKLDYLQDLGVTCLWLLPFFPSPLRDDGYDIADYTEVHPSYGTLADFTEFLAAAHERNLRVIIELVINHTSDQHPWFQAAREAAPGSPERDMYVWSDTDKKYGEARIIFTDTEKSNWSWDAVANAYYWHRFFSHQPDLNFDNPLVLERVLHAMRFWLDLGVDGLRLDAIPYLIEREGTNCENLPETHAIIKAIRRALDERYSERMMLAEANQWPTDVRPYFGAGDECHMAFHFPLMPRIFMALRMEDRHPITEIMEQTPEIPPNCQWGLFLRNHDELTLEMVSADERDYMYLAYGADPKMKINVGIRRRLAPLMENNRSRIELLSSLLFSFPGTPIMYYGDEIGMGDNIYLGDRNGVRTPMQWSPDRNAGFSRANPARLYSPLIMDPVYGYEAVNVEAQLSDASALLHWMRNMIGLRKLFKEFGRGTIAFLEPDNRKILAYIRQYQESQILCVANLSRFAQPVELDLSALAGLRPVEMFGYTEFPPIGNAPYRLSLNPYGFFWFELQRPLESATPGTAAPAETAPVLPMRSWSELFESDTGEALEARILPPYLRAQRWFAGKNRALDTVRIRDWAELPADRAVALVVLRVLYADRGLEHYFLPLVRLHGTDSEEVLKAQAERVLCRIDVDGTPGVLADASAHAGASRSLLALIEHEQELGVRRGVLHAWPTAALAALRPPAEIEVTRGSAEQSNSSIFFGNRLMLKVYRKLDAGVNPELELGRYLTEQVGFQRTPALAGALEYGTPGAQPITLALLQAAVDNQGDGWTWALEELGRYFEACAARADQQHADLAAAAPGEGAAGTAPGDALGMSLAAAAALGRCTAEMHNALATPTDDAAFAPEPLSEADLTLFLSELQQHAVTTFELLERSKPALSAELRELVDRLLEGRAAVLGRLQEVPVLQATLTKMRVHGDYHLGQVLRSRNDYIIIDFEGEPGRPLAQRRAKQSPLKDVAGMLRSFAYAAFVGLQQFTQRRPDAQRLAGHAHSWERECSDAFLKCYRDVANQTVFPDMSDHDFQALLQLFLLDKLFYEIQYELNNRPTWLGIPLYSLLELALRAS